MNLKAALAYAASKNVPVEQTSSARSYKCYAVGAQLVEWKAEFGGPLTYRVNGTSEQGRWNAAKAIVKAVDLEVSNNA